MDDSWSASLFTGDQCAACENPLGDDSEELLENGELLRVCAYCAAKHSKAELNEAGAASVVAEAAARSKSVQDLVSCRADEQSQLQEIAQFIENLAGAVSHWQDTAAELEQRGRSLESENRRLRERLKRAESLLASSAGASAARTDRPPPEPTPASPSGVSPSGVSQSAPSPRGDPAAQPPFDQGLAEPTMPRSTDATPAAEHELTAEEVIVAQKYFNESAHTEKTRSIRRSLGRPIVNVTRLAAPTRQILVTIAWEIVWYQYLIELEEADDPEAQVSLFGEGMELHEVNPVFANPNAVLDDEGRIDASELEFSLITDHSQIIDDLSPEQAVLEDATEEIWDRHSAPEFRWDD